MRTVSLLSLMVVLLLGASINAQKANNPKPAPPIIQGRDINIEDDATGNYLMIDPMSGEYKFQRCRDGLTLTGFGVVKVDGCVVSFEDVQSGRRVLASVDECTQQAKAVIQTFVLSPKTNTDTVKETLGDADMRNNSMSCAPKKQ